MPTNMVFFAIIIIIEMIKYCGFGSAIRILLTTIAFKSRMLRMAQQSPSHKTILPLTRGQKIKKKNFRKRTEPKVRELIPWLHFYHMNMFIYKTTLADHKKKIRYSHKIICREERRKKCTDSISNLLLCPLRNHQPIFARIAGISKPEQINETRRGWMGDPWNTQRVNGWFMN